MSFEIKTQFVSNFENEILNNIFIEKESQLNNQNCFISWKDIESKTPNKILCVAGESLSPDMISYCKKNAIDGMRVYVLLGDSEKNQNVAKELAGHCLVRTGVSQEGSILIFDGNTNKSEVFYNPENNFKGIFLNGKDYADEIYQTFCHLFWMKAIHEFNTQGKEAIEVSSKSCPIENIMLTDSYITQTKDISSYLENTQSDFLFHSNSLSLVEQFEIKKINRVYFNDSDKPTDIDSVCSLAEEAFVFPSDNKFNLISSSRINLILPNYVELSKTNWLIKSENLCDEILANLNCNWELKKEIKIKNLKIDSSIRFPEKIDQEICVSEQIFQNKQIDTESFQQYIDLRNTDSSMLEQKLKDIFPNYFKLNRNLISHNVLYSVSIYPPNLPSDAKEDILVGLWETIQERWNKHLTGLESKISNHEKNLSGWAGNINFLKQLKLGQSQKFKEYRERIERLKCLLGKLSPGERNQKYDEYRKLNQDIVDSIKKCDEEKKKAEEHSKLDKEIEEKEERKKGIEASILMEEERKPKNVQKKLEQLNKTKNQLEAELESLRNKKNSRSISSNEEFGKILGIKEETIKFEFPPEYLPMSDTKLYSSDGKRYLVLTSLENLDIIEKDAERLKAEMCIIGEKNA